jgi:hypothetical protein
MRPGEWNHNGCRADDWPVQRGYRVGGQWDRSMDVDVHGNSDDSFVRSLYY